MKSIVLLIAILLVLVVATKGHAQSKEKSPYIATNIHSHGMELKVPVQPNQTLTMYENGKAVLIDGTTTYTIQYGNLVTVWRQQSLQHNPVLVKVTPVEIANKKSTDMVAKN